MSVPDRSLVLERYDKNLAAMIVVSLHQDTEIGYQHEPRFRACFYLLVTMRIDRFGPDEKEPILDLAARGQIWIQDKPTVFSGTITVVCDLQTRPVDDADVVLIEVIPEELQLVKGT